MRINTRIVIVGASSTGLAALHRLLSMPYVSFTNLVLISTDGLPRHDNEVKSLWHADVMTLLEREHARLVIESGNTSGTTTITDNFVFHANDDDGSNTITNNNTNTANADYGYFGSSACNANVYGTQCHHLRVINGTVINLDKSNQFVVIDNGTCEPYDYLLLTSGRQYTIPRSLQSLLRQER